MCVVCPCVFFQSSSFNFLRGIVGKTRIDRIRNTYMRGDFKMEKIRNQMKRS
jgi:hypothetical protein